MATHTTTGIIGVDLDAVSTDLVWTLGQIECASDGTEYMYVRADEALTQYSIVKIDDDHECSELTTAISGSEPTRCGVAQVAFADLEYGWVAISGSFSVRVLASCGADVKLYTTTTAGALDDTATDLVQGLKLTTANGTATAAVAAYSATRLCTNSQD
jgi:hypothetical protein